MSSLPAERIFADPAALRSRLEHYYTRYYRETLGIPTWQDLVQVRLGDDAYEGRWLARLERALGGSVKGARLLNVGCGTGGFNVAAERAGAAAWGVDSSAEAIAIAARRMREGSLLCAEGEALPFRDREFDVVYCVSTLEHVAVAGAAVSEMLRVLRPGGALYLHTPNRWACFESHYKVAWIPGLPRWATRAYLAARGRPTAFLATLQLRTLSECRRMLTAAGARVIRVLDGDDDRPVGGPLWPVVRLYYRLFGVHPYVELVAIRGGES